MLAAGVVHGQETELRASYKQRYERQVRNVGVVGIGVETILDRWEKDCPDDPEMFKSKFDFNYAKSLSSEVVQNPSSRFLGEKPVLTLKDSTGANVYYYQVNVFDDEYFACASEHWQGGRVETSRIEVSF